MAKQTEFTAREAKLILNGTEEDWVDYIRDTIIHRAPHLEPYILRFPKAAYTYAWYVLRRRWSEAEPVIAENPWAAYHYSRRFIRGRWPRGERAIASHPKLAYDYVVTKLCRRWKEAEPVIDTDPDVKRWYDAYLKEIGQGR